MSETYEVGLLRNVGAPEGKSSVSKEFVELKRKRMKDNKKRGGGGYNSQWSPHSQRSAGDENGPQQSIVQERKIDITI
jgi:hypothetical protein